MEQYEEGLSKAYSDPTGLYQEGDTLYVAGTRNMKDVSQWPNIPTYKTENIDIYKRMDEYLKNNPNINTIIGHSAGGASVLKKARQDNKYTTITYGAPVFDLDMINKHGVIRRTNRYANFFDPVAMFDFGANRSFIPKSINPHTASNSYRRNNNFFNNDFTSYRDKRMKF